jgi:hypothetical protein
LRNGTVLQSSRRTCSICRGSGFLRGLARLERTHEIIPATVPPCIPGSIPFRSLNVFWSLCRLASNKTNLCWPSIRRTAKAIPISKGMLKRTGSPTRLRSWRETEQDRMRLKIRVRRPSPCSGTSRTQRGVRPIATSALISATNSGS